MDDVIEDLYSIIFTSGIRHQNTGSAAGDLSENQGDLHTSSGFVRLSKVRRQPVKPVTFNFPTSPTQHSDLLSSQHSPV